MASSGRSSPRRAPPIGPRDVFRLESGPAHDPARPHAHIVIFVGNGDVVTVPVCTLDASSDATCRIDVGEADKNIVRHPSCIEYRLARKMPLTTFAEAIGDNPRCRLGRLPQKLYDRIIKGLGVSPRARRWTRLLHFPHEERRILPASKD